MRRLGRILTTAGTALVVLWSALWFIGQSQIDSRLAHGLDVMRGQGLDVEVGVHRVSGFPFAFAAEFEDVVLEDPASGLSTALPALSARMGLDAPGELITDFPERFSVTLPLDPGLRAALPGLPPRLVLSVEATGLSVTVPVAADGAQPRAASVQAERIRITPLASGLGTDFDLRAEGFEAHGILGSVDAVAGGTVAGGTAAESLGQLLAGRLGLALELSEGTRRQTLDLALTDATLSARSDARDLADLQTLLAGNPEGTGEIALRSGEMSVDMGASGLGPEDGSLTLSGGGFTGQFGIERGGIATEATLETPEITLTPVSAAAPFRGSVAADRLHSTVHLPLAAGHQMRAIRLQIEAEALAPDPAFWARLDPKGVLPRTPGDAHLEIAGTGRFTKPPAQTRPGEALPLELGNLSLRTLEITALGARTSGTGDVEFLQPVNEPTGTISLQFSGALALMRHLHAAGLITQEQLQSLATLAAFYTRAGAGPDELLTDIAFQPGDIRVNGDRIQ